MKHLSLLLSAAAGLALLGSATPANAAGYYDGKNISLIVPSGAGGGLTRSARTFSKAFARLIEGSPNVVIRNMPGGTKGHNFLAEKAPKDGLTIMWGPLQLGNALVKKAGVRFDPTKFEIIGAGNSSFVTIVRADTPPGLSSATDLMKVNNFVYGGLAPGRLLDVLGQLGMETLGIKYRYTPGYRAQPKMNAAIRSKEIQGLTTGHAGYRAFYENTILKDKSAIAVFYHSPFDVDTGEPVRMPERYPASLKHFADYYKEAKGMAPAGPAWEAYKWINTHEVWPYTISAPPGTNPTALAELRAAFVKVPNDPEFRDEWLKQFKDMPKWVDAKTAQKIVRTSANIKPDAFKFLKGFLAPAKK